MSCNRRDALGLIAASAATPMAPVAIARSRNDPPRAEALTAEWLSEPVGLDTRRPRFGWSQANGPAATHVQIAVSQLRSAAATGRGEIWNDAAAATPVMQMAPPHDLPLQPHREYWWSLRLTGPDGHSGPWSEPARFITSMLDQPWPAQWIAAAPDPDLPPHPRGQAPAEMVPARRLPILRGRFEAHAPVARAFISIIGLGQYRLSLNGAPIAADSLRPAWCDWRKRVLYDTFEVTRHIVSGANVIGVMLGNGFYNVEAMAGRYTKLLDSFGLPKASVTLTLLHPDGRISRIGSGPDWRWTPGPVLFSSVYGGEDHDQRALPPGWDTTGHDDRTWQPVLVVKGPPGQLHNSTTPPVRVVGTRPPVRIDSVADDVLVVDFGVNGAGRARLWFTAPAGATIECLPGEALDSSGRVSQASFNAAPDRRVVDRCIAPGGRAEFAPMFAVHGMRYCEIRGLPRDALRDIQFETMRADVAQTGTFEADPPVLGAIHRLILAAADANLMSVITDCPHREKLGWLEQTWLNAPTLFCNRDVITLYEKLVDDIADTQQADGMIPAIAPEYVVFVDAAGQDQIWRNSPEWGVAAVLAPWHAFRFCGVATILARAWPAAVRYCAYLESRAQGDCLDFGMGDWYDLGPADPGPAQLTSRMLAGTACWVEALQAMARIAPLVGRPAEAARWQARANAVSAAFNARFLDPVTGRYERGSQTAQAMPLALGIVPSGARDAALQLLVEAVRAAGHGVTAGDIGFRHVIAALSDAGRDDVVLAMLTMRGAPGYQWQLDHGATTLAEAWDANPTKSLNHFMLGHAEGWLYGALAGLDVDHSRQSAAALRIRPRMLNGVSAASATMRVPGGTLACSWQQTDGGLRMEVRIPAGRRAEVCLPAAFLADTVVKTTPMPGARPLRRTAEGQWLNLGGGSYQFICETARS